MYAKLLGVLLLACQIISNGSYEIHPVTDTITTIKAELAEPATLPEGYVRFPDDHAAYKIYKEMVLWEVARDRCIAEGARLAIADTSDKIQHIRSSIRHVGDWLSVGIHLQNSTGEWVRADNGVALTSLPWNDGSPDNDGDCVAISFLGRGLINFSCSEFSNWYVCEILL